MTKAELIQQTLHRLNNAKSESQRAELSRMLCELGEIHNGTTPSGIAYVQPAPWVQKLFPDITQ